jgi:citrate/tricarballylate utilization protein
MRSDNPIAEGARILTICNACRYCEGYCAVFPAMERRLEFSQGDLNYLANLCHNCAECYYACQYAPPHEFAVNVPQTLAEIRVLSYEQYARPRLFSKVFRRNDLAMRWVLGLTIIGSIVLAARTGAVSSGNFYDVISHDAMVAVFGILGVLCVIALMAGLAAFWRESGLRFSHLTDPTALRQAVRDTLALRYLHQDGLGCTYPAEERSETRRRFHHFTFYGFLSCMASTTVAAIYHQLGWSAPYGYLSLPVLLGTFGGFGLLIGPAGLYFLKRKRDPAIVDVKQDGMDTAFLLMLFLSSLTGLLLLFLRNTAAMAPLLIIHLGVVLALFLALPYGKFVHGLYRFAALVRYALEKQT